MVLLVVAGLLLMGALGAWWLFLCKRHRSRRLTVPFLLAGFAGMAALNFCGLYLIALGSLAHSYIPSQWEMRMDDAAAMLFATALPLSALGFLTAFWVLCVRAVRFLRSHPA